MTWRTARQKKHPPPDPTQPIPPRLRLKHAREARKIRQEDVATYTSQLGPEHAISKTLLSHVELGRSRLSALGPKRLDALRQALGMTADEWRTQVEE
ncbi:helix-turn-helix domain-containing protein [Deinococcus radiotolerans]|uniref:HTH cro/C1-type domain-containing protein n=1 Tax=Deinococcus radiotolerans TaxID=1309407 RepID=A0ABQ2FIV5_9DEIO|nr:helix-turn-helix transcriptional regulator [Deinococcus radiotolerans]GGK91610.1 hypothetical protein GCM10010844_07670 [Deinococcus radiotolerans]